MSDDQWIPPYGLDAHAGESAALQGSSNDQNQHLQEDHRMPQNSTMSSHGALLGYSSGLGVPDYGPDRKKEEDPKYLEWASSYLLDPANDLMQNFDFGSGAVNNNSNIMQKIQFQSNIHDADPLALGKDGLSPSAIRASLLKPEHKTKQRRPCDHCRRRKTKCVIIPGTNNCAQCETKSLTCTYSLTTSKEDESTKRQRKSPVYNGNNYGQPDIVPPSVPIRDVPPIQDYSALNNSLLKKTLSLQFPRSSFYVGPTNYIFDSNLLEVIMNAQHKSQGGMESSSRANSMSKIEQMNLSDSISLRKVGSRTQFVLTDDQSKQSYQSMSNDVDSIEKFVAPHGQILIDLYFRIIHPSYPILHKKVFLEKYSRTHREFSAPLLAAVYALAIQWWDYDPQLNRFPKPNVELILKIALNNYLVEILKRPKLSAVQAGLLLLQCKHILRDFGAVGTSDTPPSSIMLASASLNSSFSDSDYNDWVLCSQVVALAEELGLGLDCDNWKLPKWERGLRKRLAWAVYMEDKWLALKNARPSHINDINWVVLNLAEEDFPEKHGDGDLKEGSSDITNGKKNFMNLISLSKTLSEILNSLFSMLAMKEITDINEVLRLAKPIQLELRNWYHSLPIELQMNSVQPRKLCSNGYLQLAYFAAELTLHRKIITVLHQQDSYSGGAPAELVTVCRTAAKTRLLASIDFVKDLKPEHIHSFWHSSASSNFALIGTFASLLFISSPTKQEADFYRDQIFNYRWILKISSKGFSQVGDALQKLDLVLNHVPGLLNDSADQPMVVPNVPTIDYSKIQQQRPQQVQHALSQQYVKPSGPESILQPQLNRYNTVGAHTQYMANNRSSPLMFGGNGKGKEMGRPSPSQQLQQAVNSPHESQASQTSGYSTGAGRTGHVMNSPQSSQGLSPKEFNRQPKSSLGQSGRRPSVTSHTSDALSNHDVPSSEVGSPMLTRSPLAQQHQPVNGGGDGE